MFHATSGSTGALEGSTVVVPSVTSVTVPSLSRRAMRAPTNSPAAWCDSRIPLSMAARAASGSEVGGAAVVDGADVSGGRVSTVVAGAVAGGEVAGGEVAGATAGVDVAVPSLEEQAVATSRSPAAAEMALRGNAVGG